MDSPAAPTPPWVNFSHCSPRHYPERGVCSPSRLSTGASLCSVIAGQGLRKQRLSGVGKELWMGSRWSPEGATPRPLLRGLGSRRLQECRTWGFPVSCLNLQGTHAWFHKGETEKSTNPGHSFKTASLGPGLQPDLKISLVSSSSPQGRTTLTLDPLSKGPLSPSVNQKTALARGQCAAHCIACPHRGAGVRASFLTGCRRESAPILTSDFEQTNLHRLQFPHCKVSVMTGPDENAWKEYSAA